MVESGLGAVESAVDDSLVDAPLSRGAGVGNGRGTAPVEAHPAAKTPPSSMSHTRGTLIVTLHTIGALSRSYSVINADPASRVTLRRGPP